MLGRDIGGKQNILVINVRLDVAGERILILETKGYDELESVKAAAAERWIAAVNADGRFGTWSYAIARKPEAVDDILRTHASTK